MKTKLLLENESDSIDVVINKWFDSNEYDELFDIKIWRNVNPLTSCLFREAVIIYEE